jgi:hypothetical protein
LPFQFCVQPLSQTYYTVGSESRCALRLRYVDLVVSIEVTVEVCCGFHCIQLLNSGWSAIPIQRVTV